MTGVRAKTKTFFQGFCHYIYKPPLSPLPPPPSLQKKQNKKIPATVPAIEPAISIFFCAYHGAQHDDQRNYVYIRTQTHMTDNEEILQTLHYDLCAVMKTRGGRSTRTETGVWDRLLERGVSNGPGRGFHFTHGGLRHDVRIRNKIGVGASGIIRNGTFDDGGSGASFPIAVKVNKVRRDDPRREEDLRELAIHVETFCALQSLSDATRRGWACIPRPFFLVDVPRTGRVIGMDRLSVTLADGLYRQPSAEGQIRLLYHVFQSVATTLEYLQAKFRFMHGDLHSANVMNVETGVPCIIDFGMASVAHRRKGRGAQCEEERVCADDRYEGVGFVPCLDLLTLVTCVREDLGHAGDTTAAAWCDSFVRPFWDDLEYRVFDTTNHANKTRSPYRTETIADRVRKSVKMRHRPSYSHHLLYEDSGGIDYRPTTPTQFLRDLRTKGTTFSDRTPPGATTGEYVMRFPEF